MPELPEVTEWIAVRADHNGRQLCLILQRKEYSAEHKKELVAEVKWLCFLDVSDLDRCPPPKLRPQPQAGPVRRILRVLVESWCRPVPLLTARSLVERVNRRRNEMLHYLKAVEGGFVLTATDQYYIGARSVVWCRGTGEPLLRE